MSDFDGFTKEELRAEAERIVKTYVPDAKCELWDYEARIRCGLVDEAGAKHEFHALTDDLDRSTVKALAADLKDRLS